MSKLLKGKSINDLIYSTLYSSINNIIKRNNINIKTIKSNSIYNPIRNAIINLLNSLINISIKNKGY